MDKPLPFPHPISSKLPNLRAGEHIKLSTAVDENGNTIITISAEMSSDELVKVSALDSTPDFLGQKLVSDGTVTISVKKVAGVERLELSLPSASVSWEPLAFTDDWEDFGEGFQPCEYRIQASELTLRGRAKYKKEGQPPDGSIIAKLPLGPVFTVGLPSYSGPATLIVPPHDHTGKVEPKGKHNHPGSKVELAGAHTPTGTVLVGGVLTICKVGAFTVTVATKPTKSSLS